MERRARLCAVPDRQADLLSGLTPCRAGQALLVGRPGPGVDFRPPRL